MKWRTTIILLFAAISLAGQDLPDLSNYQHNWILFNPAFTGSRDVRSWSFFSKDDAFMNPSQYAPKYIQLSMHTPFKNSGSNAWGFSYYNKKEPGIGFAGFNLTVPLPMVEHNLTTYYSHKVRIGGGQLSFGIAGVVGYKRIDNTKADPRQSADPLFMADIEPIWTGNVGAGALYYTGDFFVALSVPRLMSNFTLFDKNDYSITTAGGEITNINIGPDYMNYNIMLAGGNQFEINKNFTIYPSFLSGYIPSAGLSAINYMASLNFGFLEERFWIGGIYKSANEISANLNIELFNSEILLGFSWDFPLSATPGYFDNAFEIILRWDNLSKVVTKAPFYF